MANPRTRAVIKDFAPNPFQLTDISARWLGVNPAPLRYLLEYSGVMVQKMWVAANNLHRLALS